MLFFTILPTIILSQKITIGVEPSVVDLYLSKGQRKYLELKLFNPHGEVDANYWIALDSILSDFVNNDCYQDYWCSERNEIVVEKGSTKEEGYTVTKILFEGIDRSFEGEGSLFVYAKPRGVEEEEGMLKVQPRVKVRVNIHNSKEMTKMTTSGGDGDGGGEGGLTGSGEDGEGNMTDNRTGGYNPEAIPPRPIEREHIDTVPKEKPEEETSRINVSIIPFIILLTVGVGIVVAWYFNLLPPLMLVVATIFFLFPVVRAEDISVTVDVGVPPPTPLQLIINILPLLTGVGIVLWTARAFLTSPLSVEGIISLIVPVIVAIILLGILVATV